MLGVFSFVRRAGPEGSVSKRSVNAFCFRRLDERPAIVFEVFCAHVDEGERRILISGGSSSNSTGAFGLLVQMLKRLREKELLKTSARQRTDSTHIVGAVRDLNRLEIVGETLHHALNGLGPDCSRVAA